MHPYSIRPLVPADIPDIAAIMVSYPLWQNYGLTAERARDVLERGLADNHILLVADAGDGIPLGIAYTLPRGTFAFSPYLRWLAVKQGLNGSGIGLALLQATEREAVKYRSDLFLLAADFNTAAHRFYERNGYSRVGEIPEYVVPGVTEYIYWKRLHETDGAV